MTSRRKRDKVKDWLARLFPGKGEIRYTPDGPQQCDHSSHYLRVVMGLLSQHIIRGAAHDSSARSPPPRCHPETRVKLIARITTWFDGQGRQELVLWITGPAGVGKSAIVQTFAEYLVKLKLLGASVFFSRPNKRNNPYGVFLTIAYQLAARIEAYRNFVVERVSRDPELLSGDIEAQFRTFIVEPFVEEKIGGGGRRWGILLDGLDELKGEDEQCEIIHLITTFAHEHPNAPLIWIIASRPESHISNTFDDDDVRRRYWPEHIPIDSTEACADVDRFLRSGFTAIRKKFRRSVPRDWPSSTDFLKLTAAASGLFIYAEVVMRFIRDPEHADPVTRFKVLLSVIDRSNATPTQENPFIHLDTLYREILSSIPSNLWPTTKLLLHCTSTWADVARNRIDGLGTLRGMSILFDISPQAISTCLIKCQSVLKVPSWKAAHKLNLTFFHASFADYLRNPLRSGEYFVGTEDNAWQSMQINISGILNECSKDDSSTVETAWHQYCSKWDDEPLSRAVTKYHTNALCTMASFLATRIAYMLQEGVESSMHARVRDLHVIKVSYFFGSRAVFSLVTSLMEVKDDIEGLLRRVHLRDLRFGHLDWKMMSPARVHTTKVKNLSRPRSEAALKKFIFELESMQETSPELEVVIVGGVPEGRVAAFRNPSKDDAHDPGDFMCYMIPYPE